MSAVLAPVSARKRFGTWQLVCWSVIYSSVLASILGVLVGLTYETKYAQAILLFSSILIVNKCSIWDQMAKVIGSTIRLSLDPNISLH